jgi:DNA-directed DNA polymerase III PolC
VDALLDRAAQEGTGSLGLAELGGLYGAIEFYIKAKDHNIKPLIGLEFDAEAGKILFIAKNIAGYGSLSRLSTIEKLHQRSITLEDIVACHKGLIAIAFDIAGIDILKEIFADDLYFGLAYFGDMVSRIRIQKALKDIHKYNPQLVAANPITFVNKDEYPTHRILRAIGEILPLDRLTDDKTETPQAYFRSKKESLELFSEFPEAIGATMEIAEKCDLELPVGRLNFPEYENKTDKTNARLLYELSFNGLKKRYRKVSGEAISRLEFELNVIQRAGFTDYFLIVRDIIDYCHKNGIQCVGRGSAASSIVSYCLGITEVCPIEQDLYFQRFLNEARTDPPDIDIDLCWKRRDEVLEFVYEKYGRDRVAMICTLNRFAIRGSIREVAKAFGLSGDEISDFTRRLPWSGSSENIEYRVRNSPECAHLPIHTEPFKSIIEIARKIEGYPRHLGIHAGGIVIAPGKLLDWTALQMSAKGIAITQYDMYSIEDLGLVKIDLLGQRGLSTIEEARDIIAKKTGKRSDDIPNGDPVAYDLLRRGKTIGVFQIESPGLRALLIAMQPKCLNDITLALSLIRPGASESGMKKIFLERLFGRLPVEYLHPSLEPALKETLGNIIYQEQVLKVAEAMAGFTPEQADLLRRAITKDRANRDFDLMRGNFIRQSARRGVPKSTAEKGFEMIAQFAGYGFCKAHAATYAMLAYRGAYLKAHHPIEYMAAMLNNFAGYYRPRVYAEEARRFGATLKPPTIDRPSAGCFVDGLREPRFDRVHRGQSNGCDLYIGLAFVRNLSANTIDRIIAARREKPFADLFDFLRRARPSTDEAENLIKCGALDCLGQTRPHLLWLFKLYGEKRLKIIDFSPTLGGLEMPEPDLDFRLPDFSIDQRLTAEAEILDMSITCHPIQRLAMGNGHVKSVELPRLENRRVSIVGFVADRKKIKTSNGKGMVFLTMEDELDMFEVTLFPEVYRRVGERIFRKPILRIEGTVQKEIGGLTVVAERVEVVE